MRSLVTYLGQITAVNLYSKLVRIPLAVCESRDIEVGLVEGKTLILLAVKEIFEDLVARILALERGYASTYKLSFDLKWVTCINYLFSSFAQHNFFLLILDTRPTLF